MAFIVKGSVKESTTTTGTNPFILAGAVSARFRTFGSQMAIGDTCFYTAQAVDSSGIPTGEFETGLGTYSATNTLTRTAVYESSNSNSAVTFSAGTKYVLLDFPAKHISWIRERLFADRTYYVATTGSDSNDGLTVSTPFLTIQKAIDTVCDTLDLSIYKVTIQVADGTYTGANVLRNIVGGNGGSAGSIGTGVTIQGNSSTPANVVISTTSASCFGTIEGQSKGQWYIKDMKLQTTTSGFGILANSGGIVYVGNLVFGACANGHMAAACGTIRVQSNYSITGGAQYHWRATEAQGEIICSGRTITITGTPAFSTAFALCGQRGYLYVNGNTYSGSATGKYYDVSGGGLIDSGVQLPGNTAGTATSPGQYI